MSLSTRTRAILLSGALLLGGTIAVTQPAGATNIGNEGCTPGYWKNHTSNWEEYGPNTKLGSVFVIPSGLTATANTTMLEALNFGGGRGFDGASQILLRAATAAVLNAAHEGVGYPYRRDVEPGKIISRVNAALASGNRAAALDLAAELDGLNNLGCPLGNETTTTTTPVDPIPDN
jgi:hypothetical protein